MKKQDKPTLAKKIGGELVKVLYELGPFRVALYSNHTVSIERFQTPHWWSVCVQLQDTPDDFESQYQMGRVWVNNSHHPWDLMINTCESDEGQYRDIKYDDLEERTARNLELFELQKNSRFSRDIQPNGEEDE